MAFENQDDIYGGQQRSEVAGGGMIRIVMLFGSIAVAIALIATQVVDNSLGDGLSQSAYAPELDRTVTGTIGYKGIYTIRKSVLQSSPNSICIVRDNGTRSGDC